MSRTVDETRIMYKKRLFLLTYFHKHKNVNDPEDELNRKQWFNSYRNSVNLEPTDRVVDIGSFTTHYKSLIYLPVY